MVTEVHAPSKHIVKPDKKQTLGSINYLT